MQPHATPAAAAGKNVPPAGNTHALRGLGHILSALPPAAPCRRPKRALGPPLRRPSHCPSRAALPAEEHARADEIPDGRGGYVRFCQQCTKLEPIAAFDGKKRSCQASLVKRHHRRSGGGKRSYGGHVRSATTGRYGRDEGAAAALVAAGLLGPSAGEERSATSQQPTGTTTRSGSGSRGGPADTAARSLAVLADAALPDEDEQQGAPLPLGLMPLGLDMGPLSYERGSGILGKPQPLRPAPFPQGALRWGACQRSGCQAAWAGRRGGSVRRCNCPFCCLRPGASL